MVSVEENDEFTCEKSCGQKKNCGRHRCSERCCPLANRGGSITLSGDWDPHLCQMSCGKKLQCGKHFCQEVCHSGHYPPCLETIFSDLSCACGKTSIPPPVPCGTHIPLCLFPCSIPQPCGSRDIRCNKLCGNTRQREEFGLKLNAPSFQILICALCRYKHVQEAEALLNLQQNDFPMEMKSLNIILNGWCALANLHGAKRFWNELIKQGHKPDLITYNTFLYALTKKGKLNTALKLFEEMWSKGCIDVPTCNTIIDALCFKKRIPEARAIFGKMNERGCLPNVATYNSLIKHVCNNRRMDKAYELLDEMERKGCAPNVRTYHYFLKVAKNSEEALKIFQRMMRSGCMPTCDTYNLLLRMFIYWNDMERVLRLWDDLERKGMGPDQRSYTVMIHGLYDKGKFEEAYKYYNEMTEKGLLLEPRTKILVKAMEIKAEERKVGVHDVKINTK